MGRCGVTLTLVRGKRCDPCKYYLHFLCWARRDATWPDDCGCGCLDEHGLLTQAAWEESARRAPAELAQHLHSQQAGSRSDPVP